jgi:hypothetical protein
VSTKAWKSIVTSVRGLFGDARAERVVADAFYACYENRDGRYAAFSFLGTAWARRRGVVKDGKAYRRLLKQGFFIQAKYPVKKVKKLPQGVRPDAEGYVAIVSVSRHLVKKVVPFLRKQGKEIA